MRHFLSWLLWNGYGRFDSSVVLDSILTGIEAPRVATVALDCAMVAARVGPQVIKTHERRGACVARQIGPADPEVAFASVAPRLWGEQGAVWGSNPRPAISAAPHASLQGATITSGASLASPDVPLWRRSGMRSATNPQRSARTSYAGLFAKPARAVRLPPGRS